MISDIRDWFATHNDGDGDFLVPASCCPFTVIPPKPSTDTVVYCTKQHCILRLAHELGSQMSFAAILRSGLPSEDDLSWLGSLVGSRKLVFLGDADPSDLLIFALLSQSFSIEYGGLNDQLLLNSGVQLQDHLTIALADSEVAALPLVHECLGDLSSHLGTWCSGLLSSGRKIEVEALFSFATGTSSEIEAALVA